MIKPDYKKGSIVNLIATVQKHYGVKPLYAPLDINLNLPSSKKKTKIILITIDGLGYEFLKTVGKGSFLEKHCVRSLTSVLPSTTAAAMTVYYTGVAPNQHGLTGWFMYAKEFGDIILPLRYTSRSTGKSLAANPKLFFDQNNIFSHLNTKTTAIVPKSYKGEPFNSVFTINTKEIHYTNFVSFMRNIKKATLENNSNYVFTYWPYLDGYAHNFGMYSKKTIDQFKAIDKEMEKLAKQISGKNIKIIISADHGLIDVKNKDRIWLNDLPELDECLSQPLTGESRFAYCYVKPNKEKDFLKYVNTKLKKYCTVYKSEKAIAENWFGLYKVNPKLYDRIGDYILVMKEGYTIKDRLLGENPHLYIGVHGGNSTKEMYVPLIIIN